MTEMTEKEVLEAFELIKQLARMTAVNGEIGDKRDEALLLLETIVVSKVKDIGTSEAE